MLKMNNSDLKRKKSAIELHIGDFVKINRSAEKFWLEIIYIDTLGQKISGSVDNDLIKTALHGLQRKDVITVGFDEVLDVLNKDSKKK